MSKDVESSWRQIRRRRSNGLRKTTQASDGSRTKPRIHTANKVRRTPPNNGFWPFSLSLQIDEDDGGIREGLCILNMLESIDSADL